MAAGTALRRGLPEAPRRRLTWKGRNTDLRALPRYGDWDVMFYRTDLFIHANRVEALFKTDDILPLATALLPGFDVKKAIVYCRHHDDHELTDLGDICMRTKLLMAPEELSELQQKEILAAEAIDQAYSEKRPRTVNGYRYRNLLMHAIFKDCMEAQLGSAIDKMDGFCEALHEVLAGNTVFVEAVMDYLTQVFNDLPGRYPLIASIFRDPRNPFSLPPCRIYDLFGNQPAQPHTPETVAYKTGIPMYELWKRVTIEQFGIGPLITKVEHY